MSFAEPRHFRHPLHDVLCARLAVWRLESADGTPAITLPLGDDLAQVSERCWRLLRVGRASQSVQTWEHLLPDEVVRNTVSREQFELLGRTDSSDESELQFCEFILKNLSGRGTSLNGDVVHHEAVVAVGDVISVGVVTTEYGSRPAVQFRFVQRPVSATAAEAYRDLQLAATMPCMLGMVVPDIIEAKGQALCDEAWCLVCVAAAGRPREDLAHSEVVLPFVPAGGEACQVLRVGRAVQPMGWWEELVRDTALRNAVSRDHFEVRLDAAGVAYLEGRGAAGTWLNGVPVSGRSTVRLGDIIAVPRPRESAPGDPIVQFRVSVAGAMPETPTPACPTQPLAPPPPPPSPPPPSAAAAVGEAAGVVPPPPPRPEALQVVHQPAPAATGALSAEPQAGHLAAAALRQDAVPVVKISVSALPPPFALTCVASCGLTDSDLACVRHEQRTLEASITDAQLQVGLEDQPSAFWEALLPDPTTRACLSRSLFDVRFGEDGGELLLWNRSAAGTLLNGKRVLDHAGLLHGDFIGVCASMVDSAPLLTFHLVVAGAEGAMSEPHGIRVSM